jgi:hypothetical protein
MPWMKKIREPKEIVNMVGIFIGLIIAAFVILPASADSANIAPFSINSKPYGLSYGEWSAKWWQWLASIPSGNNPVNDKTGVNCAQGQNGPVWFLAGSTGRPAVRECTVPADKAILFPALSAECSTAEDSTLKTEAELRSCATNSIQGGIAQVNVDGVNLESLQTYKVQSPQFKFTFPSDNIFGARPGPTPSVSDGIFIMLKPLTAGNHTVHFNGLVLANPTLGTQSFTTDATYHLTVK